MRHERGVPRLLDPWEKDVILHVWSGFKDYFGGWLKMPSDEEMTAWFNNRTEMFGMERLVTVHSQPGYFGDTKRVICITAEDLPITVLEAIV